MTTKMFAVFFVLALAGCSREAENQTAQNMVTQFTGTWYSAEMGYKFTPAFKRGVQHQSSERGGLSSTRLG